MSHETNPKPRSRAFVFTIQNWTEEHTALLDAVQCRYIIYGKEVAPTTGTRHLQGYIYYKSAKTLRSLRRQLHPHHVEVARGDSAANRTYCSKDGDFVERGEIPLTQQEKGAKESERWDKAWHLAKLGDIENIDPSIRIKNYSAIKRIQKDYMARPQNLPSVCGIWVHGNAGCGKTRTVDRLYPDAYAKPRNDWWDGYSYEEVVLCDDVDVYDVKLGGKFKHWADYKGFIASTKGGAMYIRPNKFIVTSQYTIEEIWQDKETREALNRRFTSVEKIKDQELVGL